MPIKVLIVDDSVFMRGMLKGALDSASDIEIVGTAMNGKDGLKKILQLKPDVATLDVEMPGMTGLEVLETVMKEAPLPIVMVSTKTQKGAQITLDALRKGAVDCIAKPLGEKSATLQSFREDVLNAVRAAYASNRQILGKSDEPIVPVRGLPAVRNDVIVAIGISAGGPATLHKLIPTLPETFPATVITQHMPADFTGPFARRLNEESVMEVREAEEGDVLKPGLALIAPGSHHMKITRQLTKFLVTLDNGPKVSGFRPSVDVLFTSISEVAAEKTVAIIMTGMGNDGSAGIRKLKALGASTLAQDKDSSIVYGMPKAAAETGCIDKVVALKDIPKALLEAAAELPSLSKA